MDIGDKVIFGLAAAAGVAWSWRHLCAHPTPKCSTPVHAPTRRVSAEPSDAVGDATETFDIPHLQTAFPREEGNSSPVKDRAWPHNRNLVALGERVITSHLQNAHPDSTMDRPRRSFLHAGPHECLYWDPSEVRAAIVTCGGLCPGLNNVIREIVMALWHSYGVREIFGVQWGYRGFYEYPLKPLTPRTISHIHVDGGTFLGSSRGGFELDRIVESIERQGINQVFAIGGDGTHRGAQALAEGLQQARVACSVAVVPKTIDCDIPLLDKTFGFETAVHEAVRHIHCAHTEALGAPRGVGVVKLMGRQSGFIALHACLAARDVNLCLLPEAPFRLRSVFQWLEERLDARDHAVVVIAEGAMPLDATEDSDSSVVERDESGNPKLRDSGVILCDAIRKHFKSLGPRRDATVKYIDPSYMIRSVACDAADSVFCTRLAFNAVHGAMAGYTAFSTGTVDNFNVWIPVQQIAVRPPRRVDTNGRDYSLLCLSTGQPPMGV